MNETVSFLLKHQRKGALLDANLLLVYVVGRTNPNHLARLHHTKQYQQDFPLIRQIVEFFPTIYTTPNVLTEVSNLGKKLGSEFFDTFGKIIQVLDERYLASNNAVTHPQFRKLGLTDAGIFALAGEHLIVTADFPLYLTLRSKNVEAINFNHLRSLSWKGRVPVLL